jgi:hypothetical protein
VPVYELETSVADHADYQADDRPTVEDLVDSGIQLIELTHHVPPQLAGGGSRRL